MDRYIRECLRLYSKYQCGTEQEKRNYHKELENRERLDIPFLEMTMTTRCNLRCRYCSNLIPLHPAPEHFSAEEVLADLKHLLDKVDWVYRLKLHGGEPLAYPWLGEVLQYALDRPQIKDVRISTNGTVMPDQRVLGLMRDPRFILHISGYPFARNTADRLIDILKENGIRWYYMEDQRWQDLGDPWQDRGYSHRELAAIAETCNMRNCTAFYHGKMFVCSFAANRFELSGGKEGDYVDVREKTVDREEIRHFLLRQTYAECKWCNGILPDTPEIEAGEQM